MSRLLHELLRWERTAPAARWRSWARALAGRHAHLVGQFPTPWLALVPPGLAGERHQHRHWTVTRNLHLAVRPVLAALPGTAAAPAAPPPAAVSGRRAVTSVPRRVETPAPPLQRVVVQAAALQADADGPGRHPRHRGAERARAGLGRHRSPGGPRGTDRHRPAHRPGRAPDRQGNRRPP